MTNVRNIKVGKAGSTTVNVEVGCNEALTYNGVITKAGFDPANITRIVTHAGTVLGDSALGDDVTTIILSAPKIEAGSATNVELVKGVDYDYWQVAEEAGFIDEDDDVEPYSNFKTVYGSVDEFDTVDEVIDMIIFEDAAGEIQVLNVTRIDAPAPEPMTGRKIKVGKAGSTTVTVDVGCTEAVTYNMLIARAGFDPEGVTRIVTHAGAVLGDSAVADDVTTIILSAPKIEAGSANVFSTKPGVTFGDVVVEGLGLEMENVLRVITNEGAVMPNDIIPEEMHLEEFTVIKADYTVTQVAVNFEAEVKEESTMTTGSKVIKVGKAGSTTVNVEVGCREALTYDMLISKAGFDPSAVTRIVTHAGAVLGDSALGDDVTTVILSAPKIEAGSCPRIVKVGKAGSTTVNVSIGADEALTYAGVIKKAGFDPEVITRVVTHAGTVLMESALADDVTTIILSAPKIEAGSCPRIVKVGKAGSTTVNVSVKADDALTYADLITRAGFDTETVTRVVTHAGAVLMESALADDVTTVILSAPKIEAGM